jgi:periplasmic protein TonB
MSSATASVQSSATAGAPGSSNYVLRSELAQFCLPAADRDASRRLAYVNSVCLMFLIMGVVGIRAPHLIRKDPEAVQQFMPVDLTPVEPEQQPQNQPPPEEVPDQPLDTPSDAPVIATVVAADASAVRFAVPVTGPVVFAPAQFAQAPPPNPQKASNSQPVRFVRNKTDGGYYPDPIYPRLAMEQKLQGSLELHVWVDPTGAVTKVEINKSSGFGVLDRAAQDCVRNKWRFPPGENRWFSWPFEFRLQ